jgi:hypothetical protein
VIRLKPPTRLRAPTALVCVAAALLAPDLRAGSPESALSTSATFECLWWSEAQMDGLDPNHPPAKETRVTIKKWEYSDPVGVPHPDVVDVVVRIKNTSGDAANQVAATVQIQWLEGPQSKKQAAAWSAPTTLPAQDAVSIPPQQSKSFRYPVGINDKMVQLAKQHGWPWSMRAIVTTTVAGNPVGSSRFELPIAPGD